MPRPMPSMWEDLTVADVVSNVFVEIATAASVFFLGAVVGSFVNVILYQMPRRINLLWPPSRCSACLNLLKLVDNVPVVSWLRLRGMCRHCGAAIPRSYFRVEARFGLLFLALTYLEIHTGGLNLPLRAPNQYPGALWNLWYPNPDVIGVWLYHLAMASFVGALYLFARRGERVPGLFALAALGAALLPPVWVAALHPVPVAGRVWAKVGAAEAACGAAVGLTLGAALGAVRSTRAAAGTADRPRLALPPRADAAVLLAVAGGFLGWQAAVSVAALGTLLGTVRPRLPVAGRITAAVAVQLVLWRALAEFAPWWPGPGTPAWLMSVWAVAAVGLAASQNTPEARPTTGTEPQEPSPGTLAQPSPPGIPVTGSAVDNGTTP